MAPKSKPAPARQRLNIVVVGHVDHGKSTVVGRLLADTGSLPQGKLEQVKEFCARNSRPFEYAFLLDALKEEQNQGITIDASRIFFHTDLRDYLVIDAPGHIEFLKNMVSGAAHASAALLVIDAAEGVQENSRRHGYLLSVLGISQIVVLVNKMDRVGYDQKAFKKISGEYAAFLKKIGIKASRFIPTAALHGENIAARSGKMAWYAGPSVVEALDAFRLEPPPLKKPFRMPVQDVYKFTASDDSRRIVVGSVVSGSIEAGDEVIFYPSGKTSVVKSLEGFPGRPGDLAAAGEPVGFTLTEQIYIRRGELAARRGQRPPATAMRLRAGVFWLGKEPLRQGRDYILKLGTARVGARLEKVVYSLDASTLDVSKGKDRVERNQAAECVLALSSPLAFDRAVDNVALGRFVIVDDFEISGGGIVREALKDPAAGMREKVILRNLKWRKSFVALPQREERLKQRSGLVLVTGSDDEKRKAVAKKLEQELFNQGRFVYFLGIGSVLYGVGADIREGAGRPEEDIRRLAEIAHILVDTGLILIVTASRLKPEDLNMILTAVDSSKVFTVWVGAKETGGLACDLSVASEAADKIVGRVKKMMAARRMY